MADDTTNKDDGLIRCDACPVLCRIREGKTGACDRYANVAGDLVRTDPVVVAQKVIDEKGEMVPFTKAMEDWDGELISQLQEQLAASRDGPRLPRDRCRL